MHTARTLSLPGGFRRPEEVLEIQRRVQATGKALQIETYDTVQGLQWNGGRLLLTRDVLPDQELPRFAPYSLHHLEQAVASARRFNDAGIGFHLVFNSTMESLDVEDEAGNELLRLLEHEMNAVTVATERLRAHIKTHYPRFQVVASICHALTRLEDYQHIAPRYDRMVLVPTFAYRPELLARLPLEKLSFIVNDLCYLFCVRKDHYDYLSRCSLAGNITPQQQKANLTRDFCFAKQVPGYRNRVRHPEDAEMNTLVSRIHGEHLAQEPRRPGDDLERDFNITATARRQLIRMGVRHFKFQGRDLERAAYQRQVLDVLWRMLDELE